MRSCSGAATVKITWKKLNITARKNSAPMMGCNSTRSMRELRASASGARYFAAARIEATQLLNSASSRGGAMGTRDQVSGAASRSRSGAKPLPRLATTPTTGMPSAVDRASTSTWPPRLASSSVIVRITIVGRPTVSTCATRDSERSSTVTSTTTASASGGLTPGRSPFSRS